MRQLSVRVAVVALAVGRDGLEVLTERRPRPPFAGLDALPSLPVAADQTVDETADLILSQRVEPPLPHVEQLATYGDLDRDPSARVVAVGYLALLPAVPGRNRPEPPEGARFVPVAAVESAAVPMGFDHGRIVADATERVRAKLEYTTLAATWLPDEFTLGELRRLYEAVWGTPLHHGNFARKVRSVDGFVVPTGRRRATPGAPDLFRQGGAETMAPPLTRRSVAGPLRRGGSRAHVRPPRP